MKIIFLLPTGIIEWQVPEEQRPTFHFNQVATQVRMAGYFMAEQLYIRHDMMIGMAFATDEVPAPVVRQGTLQ